MPTRDVRGRGGGSKARPGAPTGPASEVLTVAQARERYPDQWIVVAVTRQNRQGYATAGRVIAHTPDRTAAHTAVRQ